MTHKLRSEMSSKKIDTSADIIFGSLTLLEGFVILDLKRSSQPQDVNVNKMQFYAKCDKNSTLLKHP